MIIRHFSKIGLSDGLLVHKISNIQYFETETDYLKGIQNLIQRQNEILQQTYLLKKNKEKTAAFTNLFESFIGNKEFLIKFELSDDKIYFGFIEWCDENSFSIISVDNDGLIIGKAIYRFEDLKLFWIDDLECRKRKILFKTRYASR